MSAHRAPSRWQPSERIDDANRIILADPVIEASRQQRQLPPIRLLNEPRHLSPRRFSKRIIASGDFSHSLGPELSIHHPGQTSNLASAYPSAADLLRRLRSTFGCVPRTDLSRRSNLAMKLFNRL